MSASSSRALIVNADDFGISEFVNNSIIKSFQSGILRSTSLMANGKAFDDAVKLTKLNPELDVGIHLTLVEEKPILQTNKIASLVTEEGNFHPHAIDFTKKYFSKKITMIEIRNELSAQFEKILDYGIRITHIDSHQHLHILPEILNITIELAEKYKIKFIRIPQEQLKGFMFEGLKSLSRIAQMTFLNYLCSKSRSKSFHTTDSFAGFYFGGNLTKRNLLIQLNNLPKDGSCELMCHPGFENNSAAFKYWNYRQVEEMNALIDEEIAITLANKKISLISFNNLNSAS